jgi:hypothetical protein
MKLHYIFFTLMLLMMSSVSAFTLQINASGDQGIGVGRNGDGDIILGGQTFFLNGSYQYDPQIVQMHINGLATVDHCFIQIFATNSSGFPIGAPLMSSFNITCNVFDHVSFIIDNTTRTQSLVTNTLYAVGINSTATINNGQLSYFTYQQTLNYEGAQLTKFSNNSWGIGDAGYDFNLTIIGNTSAIPPPSASDYPIPFFVVQPPANSAYNTSMRILWSNATNVSLVTYTIDQYFTSNNSFVRNIASISNGSLYYDWTIPQSQSHNYTIRINASNTVGSYTANTSTIVIDQVKPICIAGLPITGDGLVSYTINASDDYQLKNYAYTCTVGGSGSGGLGFTTFVQLNNTMTITSNRSCTYTIRDWYSNSTCTQVFIWNGTLPVVNISNVTNGTDNYFSFVKQYCDIDGDVLFDYRLVILIVMLVALLWLYASTKMFVILLPLYGVAIYTFVALYYCDAAIAFLVLCTTIIMSLVFSSGRRR